MPGGSVLGESNLVFGTAKTKPGDSAAAAAAPSASTPICGAARWIP